MGNRLRLKVAPGGCVPRYETMGSSGADISALLGDGELILAPGARALVPTGLYLEITPGYEVQIRPRSGLARRHGVTVLNSPGTIDSDYRGELQVLLVNHGEESFRIKDGDRIAQMVLAPVVRAEFEQVEELSPTVRGEGGFGHTGITR